MVLKIEAFEPSSSENHHFTKSIYKNFNELLMVSTTIIMIKLMSKASVRYAHQINLQEFQ